jgi:multidrug efflux pump subunit AcrA (membrane-fusion protein)
MKTLLGVLSIVLAFTQCGKREITLQATYKTINEAVYASGNIVPAQEYTLFAMGEGYITEKLVSEGESVKPLQPLFRLKRDVQQFRAQNAQENLRIAQENYADSSPALQEMRIAIQNSFTRLQNDSINYQRFRNLWEKQATSKMEHDRALLAYQSAQNDYKAQQARLQNTRNRLYLEWQNAQTNYKTQLDDEGNYTLTSKNEGVLYEIYKEVGETVRRGEPIALLGTKESLILRLEIDELDIHKIKIGQEVLIKVDAYKGTIFRAKVSKIFKRLNKQNQSFRVEATFTTDFPTELAGLTVEANILIQQKEKALVIPKDALQKGDSLWIKEGDNPKKIKIKRGIENYDFVEILEGITNKTTIVKR